MIRRCDGQPVPTRSKLLRRKAGSSSMKPMRTATCLLRLALDDAADPPRKRRSALDGGLPLFNKSREGYEVNRRVIFSTFFARIGIRSVQSSEHDLGGVPRFTNNQNHSQRHTHISAGLD